MFNRKIILYPKSAMKPIILTDISDVGLEELQDKIISAISSNKISILNTSNDSLIVKPSEIQAVLISNKEDVEPEKNQKEPEPEKNQKEPEPKKNQKKSEPELVEKTQEKPEKNKKNS